MASSENPLPGVNRTAIPLRSLQLEEQKWLAARIKELYRIMVTYPNVSLDVKQGGTAVRALNSIRDQQLLLITERRQLLSAREKTKFMAAEIHRGRRDVFRTFMMWSGWSAASVGAIPAASMMGWHWAEIAFGLPAGLGVETLQRTYDAWKERHQLHLRYRQLQHDGSKERENEIADQEAELSRQIASFDHDTKKSMAVTKLMHERGVNPREHDHLIFIKDAVHYREVVGKVGEMLVQNFPAHMEAIFGPIPPSLNPALAEQRLRYCELVSLRFLRSSMRNGHLQAFESASPEFEAADWTLEDVFEHVTDRAIEAMDVQMLWARSFALAQRGPSPAPERRPIRVRGFLFQTAQVEPEIAPREIVDGYYSHPSAA